MRCDLHRALYAFDRLAMQWHCGPATIMPSMKTPLALLGGISPATFLRDYWQKKPLLIRQAIPAAASPVSRQELFDLAARDDVESRLITSKAGHWQLTHGPLARLPALRQKDWALLVQGVNLHVDAADILLRQFRFIPDARLDDLMISYASDGGGVGPHFDSYDVFLLQTHGRRRWRISAQRDLSLDEDMPLKILKHFQAEQEFILEPGDMLYLPPQYAHDGVAIGECMTCSIGFRAPSYQELGEAFLQFMADSIDLAGRYADPDLAPARHAAEIPAPMLARVTAEINKMQFTEDDITIFLGEYLSEPKASVVFDPADPPLSLTQFVKAAARRGVRLSRKTGMLHRGKHIFINGESFAVRHDDKKLLAALADQRGLDPAVIKGASADVSEAFHAWYLQGWMELS